MLRLSRLLVGRKKIPSLSNQRSNYYFLFFFACFLFAPIFISDKAIAATISEEFVGNKQFKVGSLVSLKKDNPEDIELSTVSNSDYLLGAVTNEGENVVTYSKEGADVSVALSGQVRVFVSDANGPVKKGDFVGASWLEGVGMKADTNDKQRLLGIALEDTDNLQAIEYGEIETPNGNKEVQLTIVQVRLFEKDASEETAANRTGIERFLSEIAGKNVSLSKVVICMIVFLTSILVSGFFVASSIKGSFISIGRNPRASTSIYRSLLHVTMASIIILLIGTSLAYVVLVV